MTIVTRFAPSPTGFLHIGGARTALFNWLYAKNKGGKFLLRIEDTDKGRSTQAAIDAIFEGLSWLGLNHDDDVVYQSKNCDRHVEIAQQLIDDGKAYYCYSSKEELTVMREKALAEKKSIMYDRTWRDRDVSEAPEGVKPVVRIKSPLEGKLKIHDAVQGEVECGSDQLDDYIILRSDGTPTYMLAVVVDDHDMGVTDIIRGDDHLTNSFRQLVIYNSLGWEAPKFTHVPLIHGADGAKLSKRHGALGVENYRDMGYLSEAMNNYLLRLGWSHGDDEIIPQDKAIEWFNLDNIGKSPSRFDINKLENLNGNYIREAGNARLVGLVKDNVAKKIGKELSDNEMDILIQGMDGLKQRAKNLLELADSSLFYFIGEPILPVPPKALKPLKNGGYDLVPAILNLLDSVESWDRDNLEKAVREFAETREIKMGQVAGILRVAICYSNISPSLFDVMPILGKAESLRRFANCKEEILEKVA